MHLNWDLEVEIVSYDDMMLPKIIILWMYEPGL